MVLKLENGKFYYDAKGEKIGPLRYHRPNQFDLGYGTACLWSGDGRDLWGGKPDLIREWQDTERPKSIDEMMQLIYDHAKIMGLQLQYIRAATIEGAEVNKTWETR